MHLVMDNHGTHTEPHVQRWLKKHSRFVCHFVPSSLSWLNLVERWFRELTDKAIRRGSFVRIPSNLITDSGPSCTRWRRCQPLLPPEHEVITMSVLADVFC
jgi:hypothetical protein